MKQLTCVAVRWRVRIRGSLWGRVRRSSIGLLAVAGLVLALAVVLAPLAHGHAHLEMSTPKEGENVTVWPAEVSLMFTEPVEVGASVFKVYPLWTGDWADLSGSEVDDADSPGDGASVPDSAGTTLSDPAGAGLDPAGAGGDPAGAGGDPAGVGRDPAGVGRDPADAGRDPAGVGRDPADAGRDPAGAGLDPADAGRDPAGMGGDPADGGGDLPIGAALDREARALFERVLSLRRDEDQRVDNGVAAGAAVTDRVDITLQEAAKPGAYVVMWRVLSIDTHVVAGYFVFTYLPADP